jgi:hypothetical protein
MISHLGFFKHTKKTYIALFGDPLVGSKTNFYRLILPENPSNVVRLVQFEQKAVILVLFELKKTSITFTNY